jgi:hypothetical protein
LQKIQSDFFLKINLPRAPVDVLKNPQISLASFIKFPSTENKKIVKCGMKAKERKQKTLQPHREELSLYRYLHKAKKNQ